MLTHINYCLYRQHDHSLALYPLPHLLVIADAGGPMATAQFADCQCLNPVRRQLADIALNTISCFVQACCPAHSCLTWAVARHLQGSFSASGTFASYVPATREMQECDLPDDT